MDIATNFKDCLISRYPWEEEKRIAIEEKLLVNLNFRKPNKIEDIKERIAVVQKQIAFENGMATKVMKLKAGWLKNEDRVFLAEFNRWLALFREGTSFRDWYSCDSAPGEECQSSQRNGSWMLFLPNYPEGLVSNSTELNGTAVDQRNLMVTVLLH